MPEKDDEHSLIIRVVKGDPDASTEIKTTFVELQHEETKVIIWK